MAQTRRSGTKNGRPKSASSRSGSSRGAARTRIDQTSKHDIYGIALAATAIALSIAIFSERTGVVSEAVAGGLKMLVGVGAYLLPALLLLWGVSFFVRSIRIDETRVAAGLGLVLLSVISMAAVPAPVEVEWDAATLVSHGGYVGGFVAWVLRSTVGPAISYVLLVAILLIGIVIAGLSLSSVVAWTTERMPRRGERREDRPSREPGRAVRTQPLVDLDVDERLDERVPPAASKHRERAVRADDPEAHRQTVPTPGVATPKAMEGFVLPPLDLLSRNPDRSPEHKATDRELRTTADLIERTLGTFDIPSRVTGWVPGPTVTMFELEPAKGVKVNRITALSDDIALALAAPTIRILAPIPGKSVVGIEVPNDRRQTVTLGDVLPPPKAGESPLLIAIGKDVAGGSVVADLASMPHLLIAGATGTGKSVCINALLASLVMRATPAEVRLILIDPKRIEMSGYNGVPHLYVPVVTETKQAASALAWAVNEMETRLKRLQKAGARNIGGYNGLVQAGKAPDDAEEMPYIVIVIDELADLMMVAAREVEDSIVRLAQLARAAGIHLVVATQRPSTDIITGLIKTNITNRVAFAVSSSIDSRVILDQPGAERLVGLGDMLFSTPAWPKPKRVQGAFVSEDEIAAVVDHLKHQAEPDYHEEILHLKVGAGGMVDHGDGEDDPLLWEAADIVVASGLGSTSLLQRRLKVGYARAGRIMDMLEGKGVVGPPDGSKPREVLVDLGELEAMMARDRMAEEDAD